MTRWIGKRGLWGVVAGTAVAAGTVLSAAEPGETVVFKEGNKDRKVTVVKVNKRADKSVEIHGKDAVTGEEIVWVEGASDLPPTPPAGGKAAAPAAPAAKATPAGAKETALPKAKARTDDPMAAPPAPMPETAAERERRLFNGKILGRDTPPAAPAATANPAMPQVAEAGEPKQKTGLLNRIFGKKTTPAPVPAVMPGPAITTPAAAAPVVKTAPTANGEPRVATPVRPATPPPAVKTTPVATPTPAAIPVPMPLPATRPAVPVATPAPVAAPSAVPVPVPNPLPPVVPLPTIPPIPGGAQSARPGETIHVVLPVGYVPADVAMAEDIRPYATALRDAMAPSERLIGALGLANGRHGSSDRVKALLFAAAQNDPAATVRAGCIDLLGKLGYSNPAFLRHLQNLAEGTAGEERDAARVVITRLTPRTW